MKLLAYGYSINSIVQYRVNDRLLFNIETGASIRLRKAMAVLLDYLLYNASNGIISDKNLLQHIWKENYLRPSQPQLNQALGRLKEHLTNMGLGQDIIVRVRGRGYIILGQIVILYQNSDTKLYNCDDDGLINVIKEAYYGPQDHF